MERTTKIKIALAVLLVLLLVRWILGFFPVPLEFASYTGEGDAGLLQTVTFDDILLVMTTVPEDGKATHYYLVHYDGGKVGLVCSATKYIDEVFQEPVTFTGMTVDLPDADSVTAENKEYFYSQITFADTYLSQYSGDEDAAYRSLCGITALNRDFKAKENPGIAATIVSFLAFGVFCVMMAMLLKEYAGGKRAKARSEE